MTNAQDDILVRRALQADPESLGQLCRRYYRPLVAVVLVAVSFLFPGRHGIVPESIA